MLRWMGIAKKKINEMKIMSIQARYLCIKGEKKIKKESRL